MPESDMSSIFIKSELFQISHPITMGILNITPDSFYAGSRVPTAPKILKQAEKMFQEGASILDIGGVSTRPGAEHVSEKIEKKRVLSAINLILKEFPNAILSIDTFRSSVAREAIDAGAALVNDISASKMDADLYPTVAQLNVPYVLMHMRGTPQTMQKNTEYTDVVLEVLDFFIAEVAKLRSLGVKDIILDPGFGFGKSIEQNYQLLNNMHVFQQLNLPILAGISRKSMIFKYLNIQSSEALCATSALNMVALQQGAKILRVHDVKEAMQVIALFDMIRKV
jgi:dihydropteroate synthase